MGKVKSMEQVAKDIFQRGKREHFEDGMESRFSCSLTEFILENGDAGVHIVGGLIYSGSVNVGVGEEALRWIGHMEHPETYSSRIFWSERCLFSAHPRIRDAAGLALASMDNTTAIPALKRAIGYESHTILKSDLQQVLDQLEGGKK